MQEFLFLPHFPEHPINGGLPDPHLDEAPQQNMFNERKVAQMAAFLLSKQDGRMPHLKLMKLLYLAERESLNHHAMPMSGDRLVSMEHGPVLSHTLNHMDGDIESSPDGWGEYISSKENYELSLKKAVTRRELEELSDADIAILDRLWGKFGHMSKWQIRDWTHKHCAEWQDPGTHSMTITYADVLKALGKSDSQIEETLERIEQATYFDVFFAS